MKRITDIIILTTVLVLTGCKGVSPLEPEIGASESRPIEFGITSDISVESKAIIDESNYTDFGFMVQAGLTVDSWQTNAVFGAETEVTHGTSGWGYSPTRYWQAGSYVFAGAMPSSADFSISLDEATHKTLTLDFGEDGYNLAEGQHDLMVGFKTVDVQSTASTTPVNFTFAHQLALVNFQIQQEEDEHMTIEINSVKLYGIRKIATKAIFARGNSDEVITPEWTLGEKATESSAYYGTSESPSISNLLVFPGTDQFTIKVNYTESYGDSSYTKEKSATRAYEWEPGKKYTYTVNLTSDSIVFDDLKITDWIEAGAADNIPQM